MNKAGLDVSDRTKLREAQCSHDRKRSKQYPPSKINKTKKQKHHSKTKRIGMKTAVPSKFLGIFDTLLKFIAKMRQKAWTALAYTVVENFLQFTYRAFRPLQVGPMPQH